MNPVYTGYVNAGYAPLHVGYEKNTYAPHLRIAPYKGSVTIVHIQHSTQLDAPAALRAAYTLYAPGTYNIVNTVTVTLSSQSTGWTALMFAVNRGHKVIVQRLVSAGADVDIKDKVCGVMECGE